MINTLKLHKPSLIRLSLGGGIPLGFTLEHLPSHRLSYWYTKTSLKVLSYKWSGKSRKFVKWTLLNSLIGNSDNLSEELVDEVHEILKAPGAGRAFILFQRSEIKKNGLRTNLAERLSEIKIPTLIVHGSRDRAVPVKHAKEAHQLITDSEIYLMEGCKHWPQKERPGEFTQVITNFLSKEIT